MSPNSQSKEIMGATRETHKAKHDKRHNDTKRTPNPEGTPTRAPTFVFFLKSEPATGKPVRGKISWSHFGSNHLDHVQLCSSRLELGVDRWSTWRIVRSFFGLGSTRSFMHQTGKWFRNKSQIESHQDFVCFHPHSRMMKWTWSFAQELFHQWKMKLCWTHPAKDSQIEAEWGREPPELRTPHIPGPDHHCHPGRNYPWENCVMGTYPANMEVGHGEPMGIQAPFFL